LKKRRIIPSTAENVLTGLFISLMIIGLCTCHQTGEKYSTVVESGINLYNAGNVNDAEKEFLRAVKLKEKPVLAHYFLALASVDRGNFKAAERHFHKVVEFRPDFQWARMWYGMISFLAADFDNSERQFSEVLKRDSDRYDALTMLGMKHSMCFELKKAVAIQERAYAMTPGAVPLGHRLALSYIHSGMFDKAAKVLEETVEANPEAFYVFSLYARIHLTKGDTVRAEKIFTETKGKNNVPRMLMETAYLYFLRGQNEKALEALDEAAKYFPERVDIFRLKNRIYAEMGDDERAGEEFEKMRNLLSPVP